MHTRHPHINHRYSGMISLRVKQERVWVGERFCLPTCRNEKSARRFQYRRVIVEQADSGSGFSHDTS
jgi:hypothetical protein